MYIKSVWRELWLLIVFYIFWYSCFLFLVTPVILQRGVKLCGRCVIDRDLYK